MPESKRSVMFCDNIPHLFRSLESRIDRRRPTTTMASLPQVLPILSSD